MSKNILMVILGLALGMSSGVVFGESEDGGSDGSGISGEGAQAEGEVQADGEGSSAVHADVAHPETVLVDDSAINFVGLIGKDDVYLRAGPGSSYYAVAKAGMGTLIEVHDNLYGWYRITPPVGIYSYVTKAYVLLSEDGKTGKVTVERTRVKAPSPAGPDKSYKIQLRLDLGQEVKVVGEKGGYYMIEPPDGVYLYVHKDFVVRATEAQLELVKQGLNPFVEDVVEKDVVEVVSEGVGVAVVEAAVIEVEAKVEETGVVEKAEAVVEGDVDVVEKEEVVVEGDVDDVEVVEVILEDVDKTAVGEAAVEVEKVDVEARFVGIEKEFALMDGMAEGDWPLDKLLGEYEVLIESGELCEASAKMAASRVELLSMRLKLREMVDAAEVVEGDEGASAMKLRTEYDAMGMLLASQLYTGEKLPLLYRLVDPLSDLTIAYINPRGNDELTNMLGQYVGIVGDLEYDRAMKLNIVDVEIADILSAAE